MPELVTNKISIHRALSELKTLDKRIEKAIMEFEPVGIGQSDNPINQIYRAEDFNSKVKGEYQSITDLINRRETIKKKIVESNALTEIEIGGKTMRVADAIVYKDVTLKAKVQLINHLSGKFRQALSRVASTNEKVEENLQRVVEVTLGKDAAKVKPEEYEELCKKFRGLNQFKVADPLQIEKEIAQLEKEINDFSVDVDAKLSESNALTFIQID